MAKTIKEAIKNYLAKPYEQGTSTETSTELEEMSNAEFLIWSYMHRVEKNVNDKAIMTVAKLAGEITDQQVNNVITIDKALSDCKVDD